MERFAYLWGFAAVWSVIPALTLFLLVSFLASNWRATKASQAVTLFVLAIDLIFIVGLVWRVLGGEASPPAMTYLRAVLYTALAVAVWWLLYVILHTQIGARRLLRRQRAERRRAAQENRLG